MNFVQKLFAAQKKEEGREKKDRANNKSFLPFFTTHTHTRNTFPVCRTTTIATTAFRHHHASLFPHTNHAIFRPFFFSVFERVPFSVRLRRSVVPASDVWEMSVMFYFGYFGTRRWRRCLFQDRRESESEEEEERCVVKKCYKIPEEKEERENSFLKWEREGGRDVICRRRLNLHRRRNISR